MAKKKANNWTNFLTDRTQAISSGVLALILVVLGFLAINTLNETNDSTSSSNRTKQQDQEKKEENDRKDSDSKKATNDGAKKQDDKNHDIKHTVGAGESLWKIAVKYYQDGYKWTQIAQDNNLTNPDQIEKGQVLTINNPVDESTQTPNQQPSKDAGDQKTSTYTVQEGDSLWSISQQFYSGSGYHWYKIRDANSDKVGLLSNGRPKIEVGITLIIPRL